MDAEFTSWGRCCMAYRKITEENVDEYLKELVEKARSKNKTYIIQGVSFNIDCPREMELLRKALLASKSFSGLVKETLSLRFNGGYVAPIVKKEEVSKQEEDIPVSELESWV